MNLFYEPTQIIALQKTIAAQVKVEDDFFSPRFICGLDVSSNFFHRNSLLQSPLHSLTSSEKPSHFDEILYSNKPAYAECPRVNEQESKGLLHAVAVLLDFTTLEILEQTAISMVPTFPYRTGLLAFREGPAMIEALNQLTKKPDLLVIDGHGIAHPRRCGIASHLGVILNIPTIGVGKTLLTGRPETEIKESRNLIHAGEIVGALWQSRKRANPIIISPGHRISVTTALLLIKQMMRKNYRLPEPTRLAHELSNRQRKIRSGF